MRYTLYRTGVPHLCLCVGVCSGFRHSSICYVMIWNARLCIYAHTLKWRVLALNVRNIHAYGVCVYAYMYSRHNLAYRGTPPLPNASDVQEPADYPDRRGALIRDFEHYLGILKAVHSGADLQASAKNAGHCMPPGAKGHLGYVLASVGSNQARPPHPPYLLSSMWQRIRVCAQPRCVSPQRFPARFRIGHALYTQCFCIG